MDSRDVTPRPRAADYVEWMRHERRLHAGAPLIGAGVVMLRLAQASRAQFGRRHPLSLVTAGAYVVYSHCALSWDIPVGTEIGRGLRIFHGFGVVINVNAVLGSNVTLRHHVTIGNRGADGVASSPSIGDDVSFGAGASVLGPVHIGDNALVGAHALVLDDVPASVSVGAEPARVRRPRRAP